MTSIPVCTFQASVTCPYGKGDGIQRCGAAQDDYTPSQFQRDEYCGDRWYTLCPLFRLRQDRDVSSPCAGEEVPVGSEKSTATLV